MTYYLVLVKALEENEIKGPNKIKAVSYALHDLFGDMENALQFFNSYHKIKSSIPENPGN